jgi:UDPglucose 6-dehydrogenase
MAVSEDSGACVAQPGVAGDLEKAQKQVHIASSALEACEGAEGIIIATEWDEFKTLDWQTVYDSCPKPAFVFDGRLIVDKRRLEKIGFKVEVIGKGN